MESKVLDPQGKVFLFSFFMISESHENKNEKKKRKCEEVLRNVLCCSEESESYFSAIHFICQQISTSSTVIRTEHYIVEQKKGTFIVCINNKMLVKYRIIGYLSALCTCSCLSSSEHPITERMMAHSQFVRKLVPKPSDLHDVIIAVKQNNMVL